jgi:hypothetical protein
MGTSHAATLPDGRGYELVSPAEKNGGDVRANSARSYVAANGDAVVFPSYVAFEGSQGTQIDSEYLAERVKAPGTQGWVTRPITPRQEALSFQAINAGMATAFEPTFTPDLSSGIYRAWRPLTDAPNVADVQNLYRLDGLRSGVTATTLLSDAFSLISGPTFLLMAARPVVVGASTDLSHVVFESRWALTADAPPGIAPKLYEFTNGSLRLASVLPDGSPASQASGGIAGSVSTTFYPMPRAVSVDGSRVFFSDSSTGNIYVRTAGLTTEQLNASEKAVPESPSPASLWDATSDGSRAFFVTSEGLVEGDDDGLPDLYVYDQSASVGARLSVLSVYSQELFVRAVVGASADGHYVYFIADGDKEGQIYVWHDGGVSLIAAHGNGSDVNFNGRFGRFIFEPEIPRSRVTPDGRHLLFASTTDVGIRGAGGFAGYDHAGYEELYIYNADSAQIACASCNPTGRPATDHALDYVRRGFGAPTWHVSHPLSDDGRWVFFNTRDALVPEDGNGKIDAYEYDAVNGTVHLLSSGSNASDSYFVNASSDGRDVFVATRERLVGWDADDNYDIYDVRVNGGFPEPAPRAPSCAGEACQGSPSAQSDASRGASAVFRGAGDAKAHLKRHRARKRRCSGGRARRSPRKKAGRCRRKRGQTGRDPHAGGQRRSK